MELVVVATERTLGGTVVAAALCLPGAAQAQLDDAASGLLLVKHLAYRDSQPGLSRVRVQSPALLLRLPEKSGWGVELGVAVDRVSGASPRYHSAVSGASRLSEKRLGTDIKVTRYTEDRGRWTVGLARSKESDYQSSGASLEREWRSADSNRVWSLSGAYALDRIGSSDNPDLHGRRRVQELNASVTQAWSRRDLVQLSVGATRSNGFHSDPYKRLDQRPEHRNIGVVSVRWNHHLDGPDVTLRSHYRAYRDSFGVGSHTWTFEVDWQANERLRLTPLLRVYSQRAARFYYDPVYSFIGAPYPPGWLEAPPRYLSSDARLGAFGAGSVGVTLRWQVDSKWQSDFRWELYEQRSDWRIGGRGSPGLAALSVQSVQLGLARQF